MILKEAIIMSVQLSYPVEEVIKLGDTQFHISDLIARIIECGVIRTFTEFSTEFLSTITDEECSMSDVYNVRSMWKKYFAKKILVNHPFNVKTKMFLYLRSVGSFNKREWELEVYDLKGNMICLTETTIPRFKDQEIYHEILDKIKTVFLVSRFLVKESSIIDKLFEGQFIVESNLFDWFIDDKINYRKIDYLKASLDKIVDLEHSEFDNYMSDIHSFQLEVIADI